MSLKGPAVSESDNLNPWQWKHERAPRSRNTAPSVNSSSVTFERMEAIHNHYEAAPLTVGGEVPDYRDIPSVGNVESEQRPINTATINIQECSPVTANAPSQQAPRVLSHVVLVVPSAPALMNSADGKPAASKDLLEGYEEKFFLKQDGYDD